MQHEALQALHDELGVAPPEGLRTLDGIQLQALADAVRDAKEQQSTGLAAATERALGFVPWLLRGSVRRMLG
jgi:hypothetical protein